MRAPQSTEPVMILPRYRIAASLIPALRAGS
jgi:hypothetical protein